MSWKLKEFERSMYKIIEVIDEDKEVVKTFVADELTYPEKKKKAQLMAAAPDMLEAAQKAKNLLDWEGLKAEGLEKAIRKAKGADE